MYELRTPRRGFEPMIFCFEIDEMTTTPCRQGNNDESFCDLCMIRSLANYSSTLDKGI
jgi:hypothetical protein